MFAQPHPTGDHKGTPPTHPTAIAPADANGLFAFWGIKRRLLGIHVSNVTSPMNVIIKFCLIFNRRNMMDYLIK